MRLARANCSRATTGAAPSKATPVAAHARAARFAATAVALAIIAAVTALLGILPGCLLLPEEGIVGEETLNMRPVASITSGAVEDSITTPNRVRFYWFGADPDGVIRRFEWAIDDTVSERAWTWSNAHSEEISFLARKPADGGAFAEWHTFFLRAVDNKGARSVPDKRYFNTRTVAPRTSIVSPPPEEGARWASTLRITWQGEDLDSSRPDKLPRWFEYKLVRFSATPNPGDLPGIMRAFRDSVNIFQGAIDPSVYPPDSVGDYYMQALREWTRVDGTSVDNAWLRGLDIGRTYGFAVRAVDEAGAVEPDFVRNRNWALFRVANERIRVIVCESSLGCETFNNFTFETIWEVNVAPEQNIRFRWEGDAARTGSLPGPSNYGFDIPDPSDEALRDANGMGGWIGWGNWAQMREPISFPRSDEGKIHYFYLKMRDVTNLLETETDCVVALRVSRLSFTRKFLLVDDLYGAPSPCYGSPPGDAATDAFRLEIFGDAMESYLPVGETWHEYNVFGDETSGAPPELPDDFLETIGTYQNVIWDCGSSYPVGFREAIARGFLSRYVGAGGNLLLMIDRGPASNTSDCRYTQPDPCCACNVACNEVYWTRGSGFLWDLLDMRGCVNKPRHPTGNARDLAPMSLVRAEAIDPLYPDLVLDPQAWRCGSLNRGIVAFEGLYHNANEPADDPWYQREVADGNMTLLYRSHTYEQGAVTDSLPVAWRTPGFGGASTDESRGRIVTFALHPYFFARDNTKAAMTFALRWLVTGAD